MRCAVRCCAKGDKPLRIPFMGVGVGGLFSQDGVRAPSLFLSLSFPLFPHLPTASVRFHQYTEFLSLFLSPPFTVHLFAFLCLILLLSHPFFLAHCSCLCLLTSVCLSAFSLLPYLSSPPFRSFNTVFPNHSLRLCLSWCLFVLVFPSFSFLSISLYKSLCRFFLLQHLVQFLFDILHKMWLSGQQLLHSTCCHNAS